MIFQNEKYTDNLLSLQLYKNNDMASQIHLTPEETLDWLVRVATADGLLSSTEKTIIREFAKSYGIKADVILEAASKSLVGNKPEVEIIDYRAKNGLLFEKLIVSFLKDKSKFKLLSWTGDKYVDGIYDNNNLNPDIHIQQVINGTTIDYYIECKWCHYWKHGEKGYFYEIVPGQLRRYRKFASKNKRVVLIAYAYGRTGDNPRGIYLVPLRAFRENKIHKVVADKKYRIGQNAESFAQYMENYFAVLFAKKKK